MADEKTAPRLTADRLHELGAQAYREAGYLVLRLPDGSSGIKDASERQCFVTSRMQELVLEELGLLPRLTTPVHIVTRKRDASLCGITKAATEDAFTGWPEGFRAIDAKPKWAMARATCPACIAALAKASRR